MKESAIGRLFHCLFDRIEHCRALEKGECAVATSNYGGGYGTLALEARARDPLAAIVRLADTYYFTDDRIAQLPAISP